MSIENKRHEYVKALEKMMLVRAFEKEVHRQIDNGNIKGTTHICVGQEAIAVGVSTALQPGDMITSTHRGHGHFIAAGGDIRKIMAELFGRENGYCNGKGGTQHMACKNIGFVGSNGITGGGIPYATGMALAIKMKGLDNVVICYFGDGAINQGTFHESLNMAAIWNLPIIYLCENNQYAMGTSVSYSTSIQALHERANAYSMKGVCLDGNDIVQLIEEMKLVVQGVRSGGGPVLVEAQTYRMAGHSRNDQCKYRTKAEETEWSKKCPIDRFKQYLNLEKIANEQDYLDLENKIKRDIEESVQFASSGGRLSKSKILSGVFSQ